VEPQRFLGAKASGRAARKVEGAAGPRDGPRLMRVGLVAGAVLLLVACGPPVGVSRVAPRTVTNELTRSALNSSTPSLFSQNVLHRWNLSERFRRDPEGALGRLHQLVTEEVEGREHTLFALAEASFEYVERTSRKEYYLEASVAAWAFLFPGGGAEPPNAFDPRLHIATDLYNRGLTRARRPRMARWSSCAPGSTPCRSDKRSGYIWSQMRCAGPTATWSTSCPSPSSECAGSGHGIGDRGSGHRLPPGRPPATWNRSSVTGSGRTPGPRSPRCSASTTLGTSGRRQCCRRRSSSTAMPVKAQ
jgi:hypothetical protein